MQSEKIPRITEVLLAGGKMLGVHCGKCMSPLFQYHGKVMCPVCGEGTEPTKKKPEPGSLKKVEEVLHAKLDSLAEQLAKETDQAKTLELLNSIKSILEALEKLKEG